MELTPRSVGGVLVGLVLLATIANGAEWRAFDPLNAALEHEPTILPNGLYVHDLGVVDPLGGSTNFGYSARRVDHVRLLDEVSSISAVVCKDDALIVTFSNPDILYTWFEGDVLVVGETFGCRDEKNRLAPVYRILLATPEITSVSESGTITLPTRKGSFEACFSKLSVRMKREPGQLESEILKVLKNSTSHEDFRRKLGLLDWGESLVSSAASAVSNAADAVADTVSSAIDSVTDAVAFEWGTDQFWERALVKLNYDSEKQEIISTTKELLGEYVTCKDCYAYIGANVHFQLEMSWATMKSFELSIFGGIIIGVDIDVKLPEVPMDETQTVELMKRESVDSITFVVAGIPVKVFLDGGVDFSTRATGGQFGTVTGPGFWIDNSAKLGVSYDESAGWSLIKERTATMSSRPPGIDLNAGARLEGAITLKAFVSLWGSWDLIIELRPWLALSLSPEGCDETQVAIVVEAGLNGLLTLAEPLISLSLPRECVAGVCVGPFSTNLTVPSGGLLPYSWEFNLVSSYRLSGAGLSGCIPRTITVGPAIGYGSGSSSSASAGTGDDDVATDDTTTTDDDWTTDDDDDDWFGGDDDYDDDSSSTDDTWSWLRRLRGRTRNRDVLCRSHGGIGPLAAPVLCEQLLNGTLTPAPPSSLPCNTSCHNTFVTGRIAGNGFNGGSIAKQKQFRHILFPGLANGFVLVPGEKMRACVQMRPGDNAVHARATVLAGRGQVRMTLYGLREDKSTSAGVAETFVYARGEDAGMSAQVTMSARRDSLIPQDGGLGGVIQVMIENTDPSSDVRVDVEVVSMLLSTPSKREVVALSTPTRTDGIILPDGVQYTDLPDSMRVCADVNFTAEGSSLPPVPPSTLASRNVLFFPASDAIGSLVVATPKDGSVGLFANRGDDADVAFPTRSSGGSWSATVNDTSRVMSVLGSDFVSAAATPFFVTIVSPMEESVTELTTTSVFGLELGSTRMDSAASRGMVAYRIHIPETDTAVRIAVEPTEGDPDLYVHPVPWTRNPIEEYTWRSIKSAPETDEVIITHLDAHWSSDLYVTVLAWTSSTWRISVQSYELLDQGVPIRRSLAPLQYAFYQGSSEGFGSTTDDEKSMSVLLRAKSTPIAPAPLSAYAGSAVAFYPAVFEGHAAVTLADIGAGEVTGMERDYLPNTNIARQMIFGARSGFHDKTSNGEEDVNDDVFGRRRRRLRGGAEGEEVLLREKGGYETYPELSWLRLEHMKVAQGRGRSRALQDFDAAVNEAEATQMRHAASNLAASLHPKRQTRTSQPSSSIHPTISSMPLAHNQLKPSESPLVHVSLNDKAGEVAVRRELVSSSSPAPSWAVTLRTEVFSSRQWVHMLDCNVAIGTAGLATGCVRISTTPSDIAWIRIQLPPRSSSLVSVVSTVRSHTKHADAPYSIRASFDMPDGTNVEMVESAARTFAPPNCGYSARYFYISVTGNNPSSLDLSFDVLVSTTLSVSTICPSYKWHSATWSHCSVPCGKGEQHRAVYCQASDGSMVDDAFCSVDLRPQSRRTCNQGACRWAPTPWASCSEPCGGGTQSRLLECRNNRGEGRKVLDAHCVDPPATTRTCNEQECEARYWKAGPWTSCSRRCGGGRRERSVVCMEKGDEPKDATVVSSSLCDPSTKPPMSEICGDKNCMELEYDLMYADLRTVKSGIPTTVSIPSTGKSYFVFERPNAGVDGVCAVVKPDAPITASCTVAMERQASHCFKSYQLCLQRSNATCSCASTAANCLVNRVCDERVEALVDTIAEACSMCGSKCPSMPSIEDLAAQPRVLQMFATPLQSSSDDASSPLQFHLPSSPSTSTWQGRGRLPNAADQRMVIWDGFDADRLAIGLVAPRAPLSATLTLTALSSFPVEVSGTLLGGTSGAVSAAAVRAGGLTLELTLSCDLFEDPRAVIRATRKGNGLPPAAPSPSPLPSDPKKKISLQDFDAQRSARTMTPNILVRGITARQTTASGWNSYAQDYIVLGEGSKQGSVDVVSYSFGKTRATLTLPPLPEYHPRGDEVLGVSIPGTMLRSGQDISLPNVQIRIHSDVKDCQVGEWSEWSDCSKTCAEGVRFRTRQVLVAPSGGGAQCPPTTESQTCNTCNSCAGITCRRGGVCARGQCVCRPGFGGGDCSNPPAAPTSVRFYVAEQWGKCSAECAGGLESRGVYCAAPLMDTEGWEMRPMSECAAVISHDPPKSHRGCNMYSCDDPRADIVLQGSIPHEVYRIANLSANGLDTLIENWSQDMATALRVARTRVRVDSISQSEVRLVLLPISAAADVVTQAAGPPLMDILKDMMQQMSDPTSYLRVRGELTPAMSSATARLVHGPSATPVDDDDYPSSTTDGTTDDDDDDGGGGGGGSGRKKGSPSSPSEGGSMGGAIAGSLIGGLVIGGLVVFGVMYMWRRPSSSPSNIPYSTSSRRTTRPSISRTSIADPPSSSIAGGAHRPHRTNPLAEVAATRRTSATSGIELSDM